MPMNASSLSATNATTLGESLSEGRAAEIAARCDVLLGLRLA